VTAGQGSSPCRVPTPAFRSSPSGWGRHEDDVQVEDETGGRFRATGCEQSTMYTCIGRLCVPDVGKQSASAVPSARPEPAPSPSGAKGQLGVAHREKNAAGLDVIELDVRLNAESSLRASQASPPGRLARRPGPPHGRSESRQRPHARRGTETWRPSSTALSASLGSEARSQRSVPGSHHPRAESRQLSDGSGAASSVPKGNRTVVSLQEFPALPLTVVA
jgi:hypothetical protein